MGNQHLDPTFAKILDAMTTPRNLKVMAIEKQISELFPDFYEAQELLQAIEASLRSRYPHALLDDARHYFDALGKCLERAETDYTGGTHINTPDYHNGDIDPE